MSQQQRGLKHGRRPNTIGLETKELRRLLNAFDEAGERSRGSIARRHARWPFRVMSMIVRLNQPGGSSCDLKMACRNLSNGGVGLLHSAYIHVGTKCSVLLPSPHGGGVFAPGEIVRCQHRQGVVHEVGVRFDGEVDVREFIEVDPLEGRLTVEVVRAEDLRGTLLHLEPEAIEQQLLRHFLKETRLRVRVATSVTDGVSIVGGDPKLSLVIVDYHIAGGVPAFLSQASAVGGKAPIIVTSSERTEDVREVVADDRVAGFMAKPLDQELVIRAIGEFMGDSRATAAAEAAAAAGPTRYASDPLVRQFARQLIEASSSLQRALECYQPMEAYELATQLKGTAPALGFDRIAEEASIVAHQLSQTMNLKLVENQVRVLITLCRKAAKEAA